jgi:hypothetical protein
MFIYKDAGPVNNFLVPLMVYNKWLSYPGGGKGCPFAHLKDFHPAGLTGVWAGIDFK